MDPAKIEAVTRKEFYHLLRDVRSLYLAFALPLLLILLFGYALSLDVNHIRTIVVDYDATGVSRDLIRKLDSSSYFNVVAHLQDTREINLWLDKGLATLAIVIPPDFTENIRKDREAPLQVILDGSDPNFAGIARGVHQRLPGKSEPYPPESISEPTGQRTDQSASRRADSRLVQ